jgi:anti-sigma-K factor RskA
MSDLNQHNDFEALCAGYVLDTLEPEERLRFEEKLKNATPEQLEFFTDMERVKNELALSVEPIEPPVELEEKIFQQVEKSKDNRDNSGPERSSIIPLWLYKVAAVILFAAVLGVSFYSQNLTEMVRQQESTITELKNDLDRKEQLLEVIAAREVKLVVMGGLDPSPDSYGKIIWDTDNQQAVLQLANLPAPPSDKDYQLWLIKDDQSPISAGVFNFEESSNELFFKVEQLNETPSPAENVFAVTLEPKGGAPQPTGDMFLFGQ